MHLLIYLCFIVSITQSAFGYFIVVDADAEECFFEKVPEKTKMGLMFEVAEGGFLDIDVTITDPDGVSIYTGQRESSGKFTFTAHKEGVYNYCFSNKMSTVTPKVVMFNLEIEKPDAGTEDVNTNKLEDMIKTLSTTLGGVKREQEYMQIRDRTHREINESTNSRVVTWSFFEAFVLVTMTVGQVYYLKRFFEVRRVV